MGSHTLQWALKYAKAGASIIPIKPRSKEPLINWKEFQTRHPTEVELKAWFADGTANLGVVTGCISKIVVVDLDGLEGIKFGKSHTLVSSVTVLSGNGKHLYYKWAEGIKNSASRIAEGVDVRGEGGFVMAPPSIHPSGKRYRFLNSIVLNVEKLPSFPLGLVANSVGTEIVVRQTQEQKSDLRISDALEKMKQGHVHNTLISVLGKFRCHNFSISDTVKLLRPYAFNADGTPFEELENKVKEIWNRYEPPSQRATYSSQSGMATRQYGTDLALRCRNSQSDSDYAEYSLSTGCGDGSKDVQSGFLSLDSMLKGGLKSERIFTIAARTGENKTNTALAICKSLCEQNKKVLYFSTEFSFKKIWERYIALCSSIEEFRKHSFYVCDSFSPNIQQVEEVIKQVMPDVFIFDYIQHIAEEREALSSFMQGLTFLQKKYNCQGIVLAQLNRYADFIQDGKRIEPRLSMIKGADSIGQMSSRVLLLSVTKVSPEIDEIEAILDKNDSGSKGKFFLGLYKNPYRIEEFKC